MFSDFVYEWWTKLFFILLRPMFKWLLRRVTGQCELLRIIYDESDSVKRTKRVEYSLEHSSIPDVKKCASSENYEINEAVRKIAAIKDVVPEIHPQFESGLRQCLLRIRAYNSIITQAEEFRKTKFSKDNPEHEDKLKQLWALYNNGAPLPSRVGAHWGQLGFQGNDPSTDFRGMGMLGLDQLIYFAVTYPREAQHVLSQSHHPQYEFSFAIVGINLTEMCYSLLTKRKRLRAHMYGLNKLEPDLNDFHQIYCHVLYEFAQFWISEKPKDIMEFSRLRESFHKRIRSSLKQPGVQLLSSFQNQACS